MSISPISHVVVRTAFHGGGVVSRHRSERAAGQAAKRYRGDTDCTCGCVHVVPLADVTGLPGASDATSPYAAAL